MSTTTHPRRPRRRPGSRVMRPAVVLAALLLALVPTVTSFAVPTARISGAGSSWAGNALGDWVTAVKSQGVVVDYANNGSSIGRNNFAQGLADFAVSEIPYTGDTADDQDKARPGFGYAMLPVVAGGTSFMYNLPVGGKRYTDLKLSQAALAKIFSGQVSRWNDPVIAATNPGVSLPDQRITVVVRSDGSGATAQFTLWMKRQFPQDYAKLCNTTGTCNAGTATSYYPYQGLSNFTAQSGSQGVTTFTSQTPYTINYDEYSYAVGVNFPAARIQNAAGFFTLPTAPAVAVALLKAKINMDQSSQNYLSQDLSEVYAYKDPRTYPISAYSYLIVPTVTHDSFDASKGATLTYFSTFALCEGQRTMGALGYSPLPMNLVLAAMDQVLKVPGVDPQARDTITKTKTGVKSGSSNPCNNPTFRPGDNPAHNLLTDTAPFPAECDAACQAPWLSATSSKTGKKKTGKKGSGQPAVVATAGAAGGSGTASDGPVTAPGAGTPAEAVAPAACDADTGICGDAPVASEDTAATAAPTVLSGGAAWGSTQLALILSLLFAALLLFLPPVAARALDRRPSVPAPTAPTDSGRPGGGSV